MTAPLVEVVHNIPSPYRLHLFRVLRAALEERGRALCVHFMARGHADRHWAEEPERFGFPHRFWPDRGFTLRRKEWHLNPGLLRHLRAERREVLVVGGPWDSLTAMGASLTARAHTRVAWLEGNTSTPGRVAGPALRLKRALLARYDRVAVPGAEGAAFARLFLGAATDQRTTLLPNVIDEARFRSPAPEDPAAVRARLGVPPGERLAVCPARLIPAKGLLPLLAALEPEALTGWRLVVMGSGPLEADVRAACRARGLERVSLIAPLPYELMPAVYQAADLFVLPSMHDPNPLSVVEAMHAGLPLLVSRRIGNFPEALGREGTNGWSFDPTDEREVRAGLREALGAGADELRRRGEASRARAAQHWDSRAAVRRFLDDVLGEG